MTTTSTILSLNEQQMIMLRLFKDPLAEEDFNQMWRLAVELLARELDSELEKWEDENAITSEKIEALSEKHFRSSSK